MSTPPIKADAPMGKNIARLVSLAIVTVAVAAGIAAYGFYQQEVNTYVLVHGWNLGQYEQATRDFIRKAAAGDTAGIEQYLRGPDKMFTVDREGSKITSVTISMGRDPETRALKDLCPTPDPEILPAELKPLSGDVSVKARFPTLLLDVRWRPGPRIINFEWDASVGLTGAGARR